MGFEVDGVGNVRKIGDMSNTENGCSDHAGLELNGEIVEYSACFEMSDNNSFITIDKLGDFREISCSDQSFNYMETFQEILPSRSPQSDSPETDEVFDNESLFSDSSLSTSSDTDSIPEDPFFDAVDDDKLDGSGETLTVRFAKYVLNTLHSLSYFSMKTANRRSQFPV